LNFGEDSDTDENPVEEKAPLKGEVKVTRAGDQNSYTPKEEAVDSSSLSLGLVLGQSGSNDPKKGLSSEA
jgi:hypothetical protein